MKDSEKKWILEIIKQVVKDTDKDFTDQTKSTPSSQVDQRAP